MVIVNEKSMLPPPPPYLSRSPDAHPPPFPGSSTRPKPSFSTLPPHILLVILYHTFPQTAFLDEGRVERQRRTLYWMSISLRLVSRSVYIACMHILRSTYLPAYTSLLRAPYTSDPFPLSSPQTTITTSPTTSTVPSTSAPTPPTPDLPLLPSPHRETAVLDAFIALKVREDVWADASELHLEREETFRDLFERVQPRARCEDLVRRYGERAGAVVLDAPGAVDPSASGGGGGGSRAGRTRAIPFSALSVAFEPRRVALVLQPPAGAGGRRRTIAEVPRAARDERLEVAAKRLVRELQAWIAEGGGL